MLPADVATYPGEQYTPTSGTEGEAFIGSWCARCARDKEVNGTAYAEGRDPGDDDWCPIIGASFQGEAVEWRRLDSGETKCMAFVPFGEPIPTPRCQHTADLFAEAPMVELELTERERSVISHALHRYAMTARDRFDAASQKRVYGLHSPFSAIEAARFLQNAKDAEALIDRLRGASDGRA